jgi:hypothetical protein
MISTGFELQNRIWRYFQVINTFHAHDLQTVSLLSGGDHRFYFGRDWRRGANQSQRRLTEISNAHVGGGGLGNWWNRLQPGVFNFDLNLVRQGNPGEQEEKKEERPFHHVEEDGLFIAENGS